MPRKIILQNDCLCGCGSLVAGKYKLGHNLTGDLHPYRTLPFADRFWSKVSKAASQGPKGECWEWQGCRHLDGYGYVRDPETSKLKVAHRFAYQLTHGPIEPGLIIRHRCDNPPCCNPAHLLPGTIKDNSQDAMERGRLRKYSGITFEDAQEIRQRRKDGAKLKELCQDFSISAGALRDILTNHTWKPK